MVKGEDGETMFQCADKNFISLDFGLEIIFPLICVQLQKLEDSCVELLQVDTVKINFSTHIPIKTAVMNFCKLLQRI